MKIFDEQLTSSEASELLLDILQSTVSFYKVKNLRHLMHYGVPDTGYAKKLEELEATKKIVLEKLEVLGNSQATIKIISSLDTNLQKIPVELTAIEAA